MLVSNELPNLSKWLNEVASENPEKALEIIIKFSDFVIPKLSRTETDHTTKGKEINILPIEWVG
ncbi:hypothetical protein K8354_02375 [Polaribacter litorisediminis]|uniref:hypothetical protein n=1 Tax=Polaribacter litorisediminis TaxID=1908341 RepID=UPI001CBEDB54|nr:hypothetical protein [Polaribacter litorisediminis]UAM98690.1 hypothetical protein K8354_02375 [Polaribacter litorisediminis]